MINYKQRFTHDPKNGTYGDCMSTCIASILELEQKEVPNFGIYYRFPKKFNEAVDDFLRGRGLARLCFSIQANNYKEALKGVADVIRNTYYIFSGISVNGQGHAVVALNDEVVCDPLTGQDTEGLVPNAQGVFIVEVLLPNVCKSSKYAYAAYAEDEPEESEK